MLEKRLIRHGCLDGYFVSGVGRLNAQCDARRHSGEM